MAEIQTKIINNMTGIEPTATRKMLSGDGVITLEAIKTFILSEILENVQSLSSELATALKDISNLQSVDSSTTNTLESLRSDLNEIDSAVKTISSGGLLFNSIYAQVMQDGKAVEGEYGYIVLKKTSTGTLVLSVLTNDEYNKIYASGGTENE